MFFCKQLSVGGHQSGRQLGVQRLYASRGSFANKQSGDKRDNWIIDDYFSEWERKELGLAK